MFTAYVNIYNIQQIHLKQIRFNNQINRRTQMLAIRIVVIMCMITQNMTWIT